MSTPRCALFGPVLAAIAIGLAGAGCTHPVHVGRNGIVQLGLTEYRVRPDSLIARPGLITFVLHNEGRLVHNLVVAAGSSVIASSPAIPPGGSSTLIVDLTAGHYTISSSIQTDDALGDHGSLTVTSAGS